MSKMKDLCVLLLLAAGGMVAAAAASTHSMIALELPFDHIVVVQ
ncbi:MAG: hypothetical protein OZ923_12395 [Comamonadaceae bacterium]|nr:hypothetical protein [Comamonadaceae bacterium]